MKRTSFVASLACIAQSAIAVPAALAAVPSCTTTLSASIASPSVAPGYHARLMANDLSSPRDIIFDSAGHLLVVQSGVGVTALTLDSEPGLCVTASSRKTVISDTSLNHGIALSADGKTLYVSNSQSVYQYAYSASTASTTGSGTVIITNMTNSDHVSRTLYMSKFQPNTLIVARGSGANLDPVTDDESAGRSEVKAFDLSARGSSAYEFQSAGKVLGWGLRNDVGIDEHPTTGGIYTVENSADDITRQGVNIHDSNPAEELNYLGTLLNNTSPNQGSNFGYPQCFSVWNKTTIPDRGNLRVGMQFVIGTISATNNDTICAARTAASAVFHPHMAPLDIKFNKNGTAAWVTFHGSWDSNPAVGYKVSYVNFVDGKPKLPSNSHAQAKDVFSNANVQACPSTTCVRPVGLAWDPNGERLFFSSDATGEVWVITKNTAF